MLTFSEQCPSFVGLEPPASAKTTSSTFLHALLLSLPYSYLNRQNETSLIPLDITDENSWPLLEPLS